MSTNMLNVVHTKYTVRWLDSFGFINECYRPMFNRIVEAEKPFRYPVPAIRYDVDVQPHCVAIFAPAPLDHFDPPEQGCPEFDMVACWGGPY